MFTVFRCTVLYNMKKNNETRVKRLCLEIFFCFIIFCIYKMNCNTSERDPQPKVWKCARKSELTWAHRSRISEIHSLKETEWFLVFFGTKIRLLRLRVDWRRGWNFKELLGKRGETGTRVILNCFLFDFGFWKDFFFSNSVFKR